MLKHYHRKVGDLVFTNLVQLRWLGWGVRDPLHEIYGDDASLDGHSKAAL